MYNCHDILLILVSLFCDRSSYASFVVLVVQGVFHIMDQFDIDGGLAKPGPDGQPTDIPKVDERHFDEAKMPGRFPVIPSSSRGS